MWILILVAIIGIIVFSKYTNDRNQLRSNVILQGGLDQVFSAFIDCIAIDFEEYKVVKMTETEIEIFTITADGQRFVFANKLGFGDKVNYRCDKKQSSFLNAEFFVEGHVANQVSAYKLILGQLKEKYHIETS